MHADLRNMYRSCMSHAVELCSMCSSCKAQYSGDGVLVANYEGPCHLGNVACAVALHSHMEGVQLLLHKQGISCCCTNNSCRLMASVDMTVRGPHTTGIPSDHTGMRLHVRQCMGIQDATVPALARARAVSNKMHIEGSMIVGG